MISAQIIPFDKSEEPQQIWLTEKSIKNDGSSFNSVLSILKDLVVQKEIYELNVIFKNKQRIIELTISPPIIEDTLTELKYPEIDREWDEWDKNLARGKATLSAENNLKVRFDKDASVLYIGEKKVLIKQKNDRPISHYVLEYIFDNEEGLTAQSFYSEILESKFSDEQKDWRSLYRACNDINSKVSKQALLTDFLIVKTGLSGYTQINPNYL